MVVGHHNWAETLTRSLDSHKRGKKRGCTGNRNQENNMGRLHQREAWIHYE